VDEESLNELLKLSFAGMHYLEQQLERKGQSEEKKELLKQELASTQRLYNLAIVLKQHYQA
jgi:hypothetical protein